jgi:hypothetical protein
MRPEVKTLGMEEETKSEDGEEDNTATQAQSPDDEQDDVPIDASIVGAPKSKIPATRKKKEKRPTWEYVSAVDGTATYWEGGVEEKRTRTMCTVSYRDDDERSDSEDDPEELFKPQKDDESSSDESATEPIAKKKVPPPRPLTSLHLLLPLLVLLTSFFDHRK